MSSVVRAVCVCVEGTRPGPECLKVGQEAEVCMLWKVPGCGKRGVVCVNVCEVCELV